MADITLKPNRPPFGVAFETSLLEDVAFEPDRGRDPILDVSLLGNTPLEPEKISTVDEGSVDAFLPGSIEFELNGPPSEDSVLFRDPSVNDPDVQLLLFETLLVRRSQNW